MPLRLRVTVYALLLGLVLGFVVWQFADKRAAEKAERDHGMQDFLEPWYDALEQADEAPAKVVVIGDSISEGVLLPAPVHQNRMIGKLQTALRESQELSGGTGYMPAYYGDRNTVDDTVRAGSPEPREQMFGPWGLGGRALVMPGGSSLTYPEQEATSIKVWYGQTSLAGGQARIFVDGEDVTDDGEFQDGRFSGPLISSVGKTNRSGLWWRSADLGEGPHTVEVRSVAPGAAFVHTGVEFLDGDEDSGVHVYDAAHSGVAAAHFATDNAEQGNWTDIRRIDPQLILVNLGTNPEPDYAGSLETVVERALEYAPHALVVLVDGYEPGNWDHERWQQIRAARVEVAAEHPDRVAVFDFARFWPELAKDGSTNEGMMYEPEAYPVHPSAQGNVEMAKIYARLLTREDD